MHRDLVLGHHARALDCDFFFALVVALHLPTVLCGKARREALAERDLDVWRRERLLEIRLHRLVRAGRQRAAALLARLLLSLDLVEMRPGARFDAALNFLGAVGIDTLHVLRLDLEALGHALEQ